MLSLCPYSVTVVTGCQCVLVSCVCGYSGDTSHGSFLRCDTVFWGNSSGRYGGSQWLRHHCQSQSLRNVGNSPLRDLRIHARDCSGRAQLARVKKQSVYSALGGGCDWF